MAFLCEHAVAGQVSIGVGLRDIPEFAARHVGFVERDIICFHILCVLVLGTVCLERIFNHFSGVLGKTKYLNTTNRYMANTMIATP